MRFALPALLLVALSLLAGCSGSSSGSLGSTSPAATTTVLTASPNPATTGQAIKLTATVSSSTSSPIGTVTFLDGTNSLGTAPLSGGTAALSVNTLAAGTHSITASYPGDPEFQGSASAAVSEAVDAPPAATTTVLTASPNPAAASATVTLTATVSATGTTPTGSVVFLDGSTTLSTVTLVGGVATFTISTLSPGTTHTITANYAGVTGFLGSASAPVAEVVYPVSPTGTTTSLTASPNPAAAGATVTLNATVSSSSGTPAGNVAFLDGTNILGTVALSNGAASYTTGSLAASATHSLTAAYAGSSFFAASTSNTVAEVISPPFTSNATFSFTTPNQTILGFGGAEAFYAQFLDSHPYESQIMSALFDPVRGLGITFLRLQNNYYNYNGSNASSFDPDNAKIVTAATAALGSAPSVLLSSWTPPASLKSNNSIDGCTTVTNGNCTGGFGTLAQSNGAYEYTQFGEFWLASLQAYAAQGVVPSYISIQNEPDFPATYVACLFNPTEAPDDLYGGTQSYASYGKAFDAVYQAITGGSLSSIPKMIGPEAFTVSDAQALLTQVPANELYAVAHHLYGVSSSGGNPQDNVKPEAALAAEYPTQLKFETEYYQTPGFSNAIEIHNALTVANDNVYLYWGLTWPSTLSNGISTDQGGLLYIDDPFNAQSTWAYPNGWTYNDSYYTMKGYSYFIRPGYIRYNASATNANEDVSVYRSPDTKTTVIVLLNTSATTTDSVGLNLTGVTYTNSAVYRSSFATPITTPGAERWNNLGAYSPATGISMPPQSEVTVVLTQ